MVRAGYKQTEVGEIPEDWEVKRIGDSCTIFGRIGFRGYTKADIVTEGQGAISLSPSNIQDGKLVLKKNTYISWFKWEESPEIKIESNDVLLVKTGSTVGKAALVQNLNEPATLNPQLVVLKKRTIEDRYLGYTVVSENFQRQLTSTVVGGALPTLSQKEVADYKFPCPKLPNEQKAIADALSDVDALIGSLEKLITKKRDMKTAAMQQLLTGKKRLPGFGEGKGTKQTELGEIPEDWNVIKLEEIGYSIIGLTYSPQDTADNGTLVLRSSNIQNERLAFKDNVFVSCDVPARVIVQSGDLLVCVRNGSKALIGKCALIDDNTAGSAFGAFMTVFRSKESEFIFFLFQSRYIKKQIEDIMGATINQITNKDMAAFRIPFPSDPRERKAISNLLKDMTAEFVSLETRLTKTKAIKQGIMQELLTGRTRLV